MNVDLNEISMNLVPFPRLHYLLAAQSPICSSLSPSAPRKLQARLRFVPWSREGWKVGHCQVPAAHLHHYLHVEGFEKSQFERSACNLSDLIDEYAFFENPTSEVPYPELPRLRIAD
ncbi:unnamed protein product [Schistocephalus solidus]|uniref:Tubulin domain-containing protein n=1 Tax=Schistocephalus solidus TaxID=70667 RepID=A0A183SVC1_SCHSO|nr:unnamed protein product [Schistocephalus solidus]